MSFPFHPLLLALYPILTLLVANADQVGAAAAVRSAMLALAGALALVVAFRLMTHDLQRGAALASLALLAFFSYGHVYDVLKTVEVGGAPVGRHRFLVPAFAAGALAAGWLALRLRRLPPVTRGLNAFALVLVTLPVLTGAVEAVRDRTGRAAARPRPGSLGLIRPETPPDIYYIVLDAYARADVLSSDFGIDNRPFLSELERLGFDVAGCAQSNYAQTELTLATVLNIDTLEGLGDFPAGSRDRTPLMFLIRESLVRTELEAMGYTLVAFETGYAWSELTDAGAYLRPDSGGTLSLPLTAFESLLLDSTAFSLLTDARTVLPPALGGVLEGPVELHRRRVLYTLDELGRLPARPGPKLVFAHIVAPHRPYLLAPDPESLRAAESLLEGFEPHSSEGYVYGYRNQVLALNDRLVPILERIIAASEVPPIIVLQGDHGADEAVGADRMAILYAERLPGSLVRLPDRATPVNTFRRILTASFGASLPDRDEASFFSTYDAPFDLQPIGNDCPLSEGAGGTP